MKAVGYPRSFGGEDSLADSGLSCTCTKGIVKFEAKHIHITPSRSQWLTTHDIPTKMSSSLLFRLCVQGDQVLGLIVGLRRYLEDCFYAGSQSGVLVTIWGRHGLACFALPAGELKQSVSCSCQRLHSHPLVSQAISDHGRVST